MMPMATVTKAAPMEKAVGRSQSADRISRNSFFRKEKFLPNTLDCFTNQVAAWFDLVGLLLGGLSAVL